MVHFASRYATPGAGEYVPPATELSPAEVARLGEEIATDSAHLTAAEYRLLRKIAVFDRHQGWWPGFQSCAQWLNWRTGLAPGTAREKVRVARALERLPKLSAAMACGQLSYSKVRSLTRVADEASEERLVEVGLQGSAEHVDRIVGAWRRIDLLEEARDDRLRHERRNLHCWRDEDGSYVVRGRLDPEVGALLKAGLDAMADLQHRRGDRPPERPAEGGPHYEQRRADAVALLVELALSNPALTEPVEPGGAPGVVGNAERFQLVVHADAAALMKPLERAEAKGAAEPGGAENGAAKKGDVPSSHPHAPAGTRQGAGDAPQTGDGPEAGAGPEPEHGSEAGAEPDSDRFLAAPGAGDVVLAGSGRIPPETARRLACDTSALLMVHDEEGKVLNVGRRTRVVPPAIRRAVEWRDRGCRFPGCGNRFCQAHHVHHWTDGGETKLDNLVLLCRRHHRALHEGGFRMEGDGQTGYRFYHPSGWEIEPAPPLPVVRDGAGAIRQENLGLGLEMDAGTAAARHPHRSIDLYWIMRVLRQ